jgi:hypothetical protein
MSRRTPADSTSAKVKAHTAGGFQRFGDLVVDLLRVDIRTHPLAIIAQLNDLSQSSTPPQMLFAPGARRAAGKATTIAAAARAVAKAAAGEPVRWSNQHSGADGNGIELEITNAPLGLCSSSLSAPFSERALCPKA